MDNKVDFQKGTRAEYEALINKDNGTFYYISDEKRCYIGDVELSNTGIEWNELSNPQIEFSITNFVCSSTKFNNWQYNGNFDKYRATINLEAEYYGPMDYSIREDICNHIDEDITTFTFPVDKEITSDMYVKFCESNYLPSSVTEECYLTGGSKNNFESAVYENGKIKVNMRSLCSNLLLDFGKARDYKLEFYLGENNTYIISLDTENSTLTLHELLP